MTATEASASIQNAANPMEMKCINTIRTLSMDAVQAANSGHPGTPMSMAPLAYCLWQEFCATIQRTRTGPTATASFFPPGTLPCCSIRCCISPELSGRGRITKFSMRLPFRLMKSKDSASSAAYVPGIRNLI